MSVENSRENDWQVVADCTAWPRWNSRIKAFYLSFKTTGSVFESVNAVQETLAAVIKVMSTENLN